MKQYKLMYKFFDKLQEDIDMKYISKSPSEIEFSKFYGMPKSWSESCLLTNEEDGVYFNSYRLTLKDENKELKKFINREYAHNEVGLKIPIIKNGDIVNYELVIDVLVKLSKYKKIY